MNFDRIVRTDIAADGDGVLATMRFDEETVRDMAGKIDAELFDRLAAERGYRKQDVDVAALLGIAARLEESAEYGSWQAETAGRIREAVEDRGESPEAAATPGTPGCSCNGLRDAIAARDRYRAKALRLVCSRIEYFDGHRGMCERCAVRLSGGDVSYGYCAAVLREVDGE